MDNNATGRSSAHHTLHIHRRTYFGRIKPVFHSAARTPFQLHAIQNDNNYIPVCFWLMRHFSGGYRRRAGERAASGRGKQARHPPLPIRSGDSARPTRAGMWQDADRWMDRCSM